MTKGKKKSNAGRPRIENKKQFIGLKASELAINNCEAIAKKTGDSFSLTICKAMESYKPEELTAKAS